MPSNVVDISATRYMLNYAHLLRGLATRNQYPLAPSTFMVLVVILSHTVAVGKGSITISLRRLAGGLDDAVEGEYWKVVQSPLPITFQTVRKAIRELEAFKYITVTRNAHVVNGSPMASTIHVDTGGLLRYMDKEDSFNFPEEYYAPPDCLQLPTSKQPAGRFCDR